MNLQAFRRALDDDVLLYAAQKLSEIRPEVVPTREEDATEDANADARPAASATSAPRGADPRAELCGELGGAAAGDLDAEMSQPRPTENCSLFDARYRVPRSQVWERSRGGQSGHVHLYVKSFQEFHAGRIHRKFGQALCGVRPAWYDRAPLEGEEICPRCAEIAARQNAKLSGEVAT